MKRILLTLDEDIANLLAHEPNRSATIRNAIKLYKSDIRPETLQGMQVSYSTIIKLIKDLDSKVDYIAKKIQ